MSANKCYQLREGLVGRFPRPHQVADQLVHGAAANAKEDSSAFVYISDSVSLKAGPSRAGVIGYTVRPNFRSGGPYSLREPPDPTP